jgi:Flp pilus assembly protein TadD/tRNA A-37 threonylcarbamoyl transferase component Bud32
MATPPTLNRSLDEAARRRFEAAWRTGRPEPIERFLPAEDDRHYLPTLEELVHIELEFAWKAWHNPSEGHAATVNRPASVEAYLERFPRLRDPDVIQRLLQQEYQVRHRHGDLPQLEEYCDRFPELTLLGQGIETWLKGSGRTASAGSGSASRPGMRIDRYVLAAEHARGGFGLVWRAEDKALGREVALKQLSSQLLARPGYRQRFLAEARIAAQLQHPGIVPVYDVGEAPSGDPYYAMKLVRGQTFTEAIRSFHQTPRTPGEKAVEHLRLLNAFLSVARAMAYAHSRHVIHRDLKPDNILLGDFGETVILDWGLAKVLRAEPAAPDPVPHEGGPSPVDATQAGTVLGTPSYMAPEQAAGLLDQVDEKSDTYALGAMLYQVLTGRPAFVGNSSEEVLAQVLRSSPPAPRTVNPAIPRPMEAICLRAMARQRSERYAAVSELARDLERYLADEPVGAYREPRRESLRRWARRHRTAVASASVALLLIVAGAVAGLFFWQAAENRRLQDLRELQTSVDASERLVLEEMQAGEFDNAEKAVAQTIDRVRGKAELDETRSRLVARLDRVHRLREFYRLANEGEKLAFLEYDEEAASACEKGLDRIGVLAHPGDWHLSGNLPTAELTDAQVGRLHEFTYRTLLLLAALRAKLALMNYSNLKARPEDFQAILEVVSLAQAYRPDSRTAYSLEVFARWGLDGRIPDMQRVTHLAAADVYFLGIAQFWVYVASQDKVSRALTGPLSQKLGLNVGEARATSEWLLRTAVSRDPKHYWSHFWLGWTLAVAGNDHAGELAFNNCVTLRPDYALGYAERAQSLLRRKQHEYERYRNGFGTFFAAAALGPVRALPFFVYRTDLLQPPAEEVLADFDRRILEDVRQAAEREPREPWVHFLRGRALAILDRRAEALEAWTRALELERPLAAWVGRRVYGDKVTSLTWAADYAQLWTQIDPRDCDAWAVLATANLALGKDKETRAASSPALALDSTKPQALAVRGMLALRAGQPQAALDDFAVALTRSSRNGLAASGQAAALEALGRREQALAAFDQLLEIAPTDWHRQEARLGRARILAQLGRHADARADFEQVAEEAGTARHRLSAYLGAARALAAEGRLDEARKAEQRAARIDPDAAAEVARQLFR